MKRFTIAYYTDWDASLTMRIYKAEDALSAIKKAFLKDIDSEIQLTTVCCNSISTKMDEFEDDQALIHWLHCQGLTLNYIIHDQR